MKRVKLFALISLLFIGLGHAWGENVTFTPGTDNTATAKSGVTISMSNTTGDNGYYQAYASSSMIVTSTAGNITAITFTCTASGANKYGPGNFSTQEGEYSYNGTTGSWSGSADKVSLSASAQVRMYAITVTIESGVTYTDDFFQQAGTHTTPTCLGKRSRYVPPAYPDSAPTYSSHLRFVLLFIVCQRPFALCAPRLWFLGLSLGWHIVLTNTKKQQAKLTAYRIAFSCYISLCGLGLFV